MGTRVSVGNMAEAIMKELDAYNDLAAEGVKTAVKDAAKTVKQGIQENAPVRTGKYKKSWATKNTAESANKLEVTVYSRNRYQIAHLLEHGHAKRGGGRVSARPMTDIPTDICKRNGKSKLIWFADKDKTLNYNPASDEMVLSVHRWFANKSCPGDWLYNRLGDLAAKVTANLSGTSTVAETPTSMTSFPALPFTVKVIIDDLNYRSEPSMSGAVKGQTGKGVFTITQVSDGWGKLKSGAGWIYLENPSYCTVQGSTVSTPKTDMTTIENSTVSDEETIWDTLFAFIGNAYGTAGLMGNLYAESALKANNLQNNGNTKLGMTDAEFTAAFDKGFYAEDTFIHDGYGYGLAQWTYYSRKQALLDFAKVAGTSIGNLAMQLGFLCEELKSYSSVLNTLKNATSVRAASDSVLTKYERPADQSESVQVKRAGYGQTYYNKYAKKEASAPVARTLEERVSALETDVAALKAGK